MQHLVETVLPDLSPWEHPNGFWQKYWCNINMYVLYILATSLEHQRGKHIFAHQQNSIKYSEQNTTHATAVVPRMSHNVPYRRAYGVHYWAFDHSMQNSMGFTDDVRTDATTLACNKWTYASWVQGFAGVCDYVSLSCDWRWWMVSFLKNLLPFVSGHWLCQARKTVQRQDAKLSMHTAHLI
jgi:hypothetical protein